ncbi:hypothetical protein L596_005510 [Steinernema carpocapsae]|uniref:Uncharacterized protein n=1 Tax=Steinernema carpocapsae TaxID=34508 RepID=A0A4V6I8P9_STECR|nr:hypothetical protein L596_005510 [Steinernema carpocapsae]
MPPPLPLPPASHPKLVFSIKSSLVSSFFTSSVYVSPLASFVVRKGRSSSFLLSMHYLGAEEICSISRLIMVHIELEPFFAGRQLWFLISEVRRTQKG